MVAVFFSTSAQSETGKFSPAAKEPGESKILLVDDDMELQYSGPYLEATHIVTALNDGGYSYDIFRTGQFDGDNYELPSGEAGLSMVDNYEVVIWYSGWNTNILSSSEVDVMEHYLDGDCGEVDNFCAQTRNIILLTQMIDWVDWGQSSFLNNYLHADTEVSSYLVVDGTSNPMDGVSDSIFDNKDFATDTAGTYYMDRPCGIKPFDNTATGAFWMNARMGSSDGHEYHAVQFPVDDYVGNQNHKAFTFANEIGVFNERSERADFFATILDWMEVEEETTQDNDLGISSLEIPRHHAHGEIDANVPIEIKVGVTNYGNEAVGSVNVRLKMKTEEGLVLYDNTLDTRAFPEDHPMYIEEVLEPGETIIFNFAKANDRYQRVYEGESEYYAIPTMTRLSGLFTLDVEVGGSDTNPSNNKIITKIFTAAYVQTFEPGTIGYYYYLGDTDDNGASSYDGVNWHLVDSYDWDADGCGWASEVSEDCDEDDGTLNHTGFFVAKNGDYALASFNQNAWYKDDANSDEFCDWGDMSDPDCPKFVPNPNQDDYVMFGPFDFSGMEEVVVNYFYSGCLESGDYHRLQISKDEGYSWSNIYSESGLCANEGAWYMHQGENTRYPGLELDSEWYGSDDADYVYIRIQMDTDDDQITESSDQPYSGLFIDDFIIRGTGKLTRDVAVGDISVREGDDMIVKDSEGNSLWREINATVINAGESPWSDLPVRFSVTNSQGDDMSDYLDYSEPSIWQLNGDSRYGDITAEGAEEQTELFVLFETPYSDAYYVTVEVLAPYGKDFFPANNSRTVKVCIFSDGDDEDDDCVGNSYDECPGTPDGEEADEYGCSYSQRDNDSDGIINGVDNCPDTIAGEEVDDYGCSDSQRDTDSDGITDDADECPDTIAGEEVDEYGCSDSQKDSDNDGITDDMDYCPDTIAGEEVDEYGCLVQTNPELYVELYLPFSTCLREGETADTVTFWAEILNAGGTATDIDVTFYIDDVQLGQVQTIPSLDLGEQVTITIDWVPGQEHSSEESFPISVNVSTDSTHHETTYMHRVTEYQTTTGIKGGEVIGYDIVLARSSPTASWIASEDGSGAWQVQTVKVSEPKLSIDLVHWYLLDEEGNTVYDGLLSDIYYQGHVPAGKAVAFVDNDLNCMLSAGDKIEFYPGEAGSDLETIDDIVDYSVRFMTESSPLSEEETKEEETKEEETKEEETEEEETEEELERVEVPALGIVSLIITTLAVASIRRRT